MSHVTDPTTPVALVLAAGSGSRIGSDRPKQLLPLLGKPVFLHAVARHCASGFRVIVVSASDIDDDIRRELMTHLPHAAVHVVTGGATRRESVLAGVAAIPDETGPDTGVIIQNAVSPNTPTALVAACLDRLASYDGSQAYVPIELTAVMHHDGELDRVVPRADIGYTADPTVYRRAVLDQIADVLRAGPAGDTTIDVARRLGARIAMVTSSASNRKITLPDDLPWMEREMSTPES